MQAQVENDQEDCQMQPLDLSCPKTRETRENHCASDDEEQVRVRNFVSSHRPRSSSGGSDESIDLTGTEFDQRHQTRDLVKAAALLRNCWPQAAAAAAAGLTPILLDGPARKRFLTKYLHKNGETFFATN